MNRTKANIARALTAIILASWGYVLWVIL